MPLPAITVFLNRTRTRQIFGSVLIMAVIILALPWLWMMLFEWDVWPEFNLGRPHISYRGVEVWAELGQLLMFSFHIIAIIYISSIALKLLMTQKTVTPLRMLDSVFCFCLALAWMISNHAVMSDYVYKTQQRLFTQADIVILESYQTDEQGRYQQVDAIWRQRLPIITELTVGERLPTAQGLQETLSIMPYSIGFYQDSEAGLHWLGSLHLRQDTVRLGRPHHPWWSLWLPPAASFRPMRLEHFEIWLRSHYPA